MDTLSSQHIAVFFLSLGILLGVARLLGALAQRLQQPSIVGELLAGIILGPTILGQIAPELNAFLFPASGPNAIALEAIATLAVVLFLLVAGIEVDLSTIWRQGRLGLKVAMSSMALPFFIGLSIGFTPLLVGRPPEIPLYLFALFFAAALSISALPCIAKTLMDMNLYRSDLGMVVISAAVFNDLLGWIIFAMVLSLLGGSAAHSTPILLTVFLSLVFTVGMLTVGRWLVHKSLPLVEAYTEWPGGVLGFALTLALLGAAVTEWIGIHAIFGSFLMGVAIGDSAHLREHTRVTMENFISSIFAPIFLASIGLKVNFVTHFDLGLTLLVLALACAGKLLGGFLGGIWGGMPRREAWAVGFAMNSRGTMEIILGLLALSAGIITQPLFVALICMAILTSMIAGPMMRIMLRPEKKRRLQDVLSERLFIPALNASSPRDAIYEMAAAAAEVSGLDAEAAARAVWEREQTLSTGIGNSVALPHARLASLSRPLVVIGLSDAGIDFDAPDGQPAHVIFLILTPAADPNAQLELAAGITRLFRHRRLLEQALRAKSFAELMTVIYQAELQQDRQTEREAAYPG